MWIYCLFYLYHYVQSVKIFLFFCNVHFLCILYSLHSYTCTDNHVELLLWQDQACTHTHINKKMLYWAGVVTDSHTKSWWVCSFVTGAALKQRLIFLQCGSQQTYYTKHCHKNLFMQLEEVMNWFLGSRTHGYFYTPLSWPRNQSCMKPWSGFM